MLEIAGFQYKTCEWPIKQLWGPCPEHPQGLVAFLYFRKPQDLGRRARDLLLTFGTISTSLVGQMIVLFLFCSVRRDIQLF
jgi:hypothetical protein